MHRIYLLMRIFLIKFLLIFISHHIVLADNANTCVSLPASSNDQLNSYMKYMFYKGSCDNDGTFNFKMKNIDNSDFNAWQDISIDFDNPKYINLFKNPNGTKLLELDSGSGQRDYLVMGILLFLEKYDSSVCLSYPTVNGSVPLLCKAEYKPDDSTADNPCFSNQYSKYHLGFSGRIIDCITTTLDKVFVTKSLSADSVIANFIDFQSYLQKAIFAALTIYIIFFGIKILLEPDQFNLQSVSKFVLVFLLVLYFSVGLNTSEKKAENGFISLGLPFFKTMSYSVANLVFNSSDAVGLCDFSKVDYDKDKDLYKLWDSIDCRLFSYLGVSPIKISGETVKTKHLPSALKEPYTLGLFVLTAGLIMAGNLLFAVFALIFILFFMSLILFFISTFCVYLITLYVMAYISPIFIPMALFRKTRQYFDVWLKICISCALQPAILVGFIVLMLTLYDQVIYNNCTFYEDITSGIISGYHYGSNLSSECLDSFGYKTTKYYLGDGWDTQNLFLFQIPYLRDIFNANVNMLYVMFFCILGYFFSKSLTRFSSQITEGPDVSIVSFGPTALVDYLMRPTPDKEPAGKEQGEDSKAQGKSEGGRDTIAQGNEGGDSVSQGNVN